MAQNRMEKGTMIGSRKNKNKSKLSKLETQLHDDDDDEDELLYEILTKIRARRERMVQISKHRYSSSASVTTTEGSSSPDVVSSPTRRRRRRIPNHASQLRKGHLFQEQQQQQQQQLQQQQQQLHQQQSIRQSVKDFLSHLKRYEREAMELQAKLLGGNDEDSSSIVPQEEVTDSVRSRPNLRNYSKVSNPQRDSKREPQTFRRKSTKSYTQRTSTLAKTLHIPVKVPKPIPETFLFENQQFESFHPMDNMVPKFRRLVIHEDALLDHDEDSEEDDDDDDHNDNYHHNDHKDHKDDSLSQESEDTYVPDHLKHLFHSTLGTKEVKTPSLDPASFHPPAVNTPSCFRLPDVFPVTERVWNSNETKLVAQSNTIPLKQHETTNIAVTGLNATMLDNDMPHDEGAAAAVAAAKAKANESWIFPYTFVSSLLTNVPQGSSLTTTPAAAAAAVPRHNSSHQEENHKRNVEVNPYMKSDFFQSSRQWHATCAKKIETLTSSENSSGDIHLPTQKKIPMLRPQGLPNLQDIQKSMDTIQNDFKKYSLQTKRHIESLTRTVLKPLDRKDIQKLNPLQNSGHPSCEVFPSRSMSQSKNQQCHKDQSLMKATETIPTLMQVEERTKENRNHHQLLKTSHSYMTRKKDIEVDNSLNTRRSILRSESFRKSPFQSTKLHRHPKESKIKMNELKFDVSDPFSLEVILPPQDPKAACTSSLPTKKNKKNKMKKGTKDEGYPSDEEPSLDLKSNNNPKADRMSVTMDNFQYWTSSGLSYIPEFFHNILFYDSTENSQTHPTYMPADPKKDSGVHSHELEKEESSQEEEDEVVSSLEEEDEHNRLRLEDGEGWSLEDGDDDDDQDDEASFEGTLNSIIDHDDEDNENEPSFEDTINSRNDQDDDDDAHSVALSEGVDRVLDIVTESEMMDTYADSDDIWLAEELLKQIAKAQNVGVDDLIDTVCDKLDAFDAPLFHTGNQHETTAAAVTENNSLQNSVEEDKSPYWSPHDFIRVSTQFSI